jgi:epoxyqueuosine reductase
MDTCPTGAITGPGQLNASRCLAYLTIEHDGAIPLEFRVAIKDRVFGCDTCLEACPWNRAAGADSTRTPASADAALLPHPLPVRLRDTFFWTDTDFAACFAGTPLKRLGRRRWLRNASIVLGNTGGAEDIPVLKKLATGEDSLLAEHAAWALGRLEKAAGESPSLPAALRS